MKFTFLFSLLVIKFIFSDCCLNAQNGVGVVAAGGRGNFIDFTKEDHYSTDYPTSSLVSAGLVYTTQLDSLWKFRFEVQFASDNAEMDIEYLSGHSSFRKKLDFQYQKLQLNVLYPFKLTQLNRIGVGLNVGPSASWLLNEQSESSEWS
jgi:hypothetical protein